MKAKENMKTVKNLKFKILNLIYLKYNLSNIIYLSYIILIMKSSKLINS